MITVEELKALISSTDWFSRVGEPDFAGQADFIQLPNLEQWRSVTGMLANEPVPSLFDEGMERLPTGRDEDDPIYGNSLKDKTKALGKERAFAHQTMEVYKITLKALHPFHGHTLLKVGPHDFTEGARGAALYAARQTAYELLLGEPGFWCRALEVFHAGHWPLGFMPDRRIVVL